MSDQDILGFVYLSHVYVLVFLCLIYVIWFFIIILILIATNHIISLTQKNLLFSHVCQKFSFRVSLCFWLIFYQFQHRVLIKVLLIKKKYGTSLQADVDNTLWRFRMFGRFATTLCGFRITLNGLRIRYAVLELRLWFRIYVMRFFN